MSLKTLPGTLLTTQVIASRIDQATMKGKVEKLEGGTDRTLIPFRGDAIRAAFSDEAHGLHAVVLSHSGDVIRYNLVPVEDPKNLSEVTDVLRFLTGHSGLFGKGRLFADEFGVFVYANASGDLRTFVAKGFGVNNDFPKNFSEPSGAKWSLVATVAHSHLGNLSPSPSDQTVMQKIFRRSGQQRALIVGKRSGELLFAANAPEKKVDASQLRLMTVNSLFE